MANTLKFGAGNWATKEGSTLAYNDESGNFKPLPFDFTRASSATVVNQQGLIETVGIGLPRIDFLGNTKGALLLEPSRTNLIITSDSGVYGSNPASEILTTAPDGTNTAVRPVPSTGSNRYTGQISGGTYATNTKITYSWYIKRISTPVIDTYVGDLRPNALVNVTQVGSTIQVESDINGFDRFSATFNITDGSLASNIRLYFGAIIGTGNSSISYWGHQLEVGSFASSYIPTSGTDVTRSAETATGAGNANLFNITEGTFFVDLFNFDSLNSSLISLSDGTDSQKITLLFEPSLTRVRTFSSGGVLYYDTLNYNQRNKILVTFKLNEYKTYINGVLVSTDTTATVPTGMDRLNFSDKSATILFFEGEVYETRVYDRVLTEAEAIKLTTI